MKISANNTRSGLAELQTSLHWYVEVSNGPVGDIGSGNELQVRVQTATLPTAEHEYVPVELQGHTVKFLGKTTKAGQLTWSFVEGTDAKVTAYFMKWAQSAWAGDGSDTQGTQISTQDMKSDIKMYLLGPDDKVTQTYTLVGAMPSIPAGVDLTQTADPVNVEITWDYDDFHITAGDVKW